MLNKIFSKKSQSAENESFSPFPIFVHCRTIPYPKSLPNYALSKNIAELYPILILYRTEKIQKIFPKNLTVPKMGHSAHSLSLNLAKHTRLVLTIKKLSASNQTHARKTLILRQPIRTKHKKTIQLRQPNR